MSKERHAYLAMQGEGSRSREFRRVRTWRMMRLGFISLLLLLLIAGGMTFMRQRAEATALAADAKTRGKLYASVVHAEPGNTDQTISLPGTLLGLVESPISSRASGYLVRWTKDIGSQAKRGELLAEVSSPETEQQLAQAMAARQQSLSALNLAKVTMDRWRGLLDQRAVSQQEFDERRSAYEQALANLGAVDANIQRLKELLSFTRIVAPFDGVITKRNVNVGDLIDAGATATKPLFMLVQMQTLRAYVNVPQAYAAGIKVGETVILRQPEIPNQKFEAKIVRTARAIDPVSRSLQVEINIDNRQGRLMPGAYVDVSVPAGHNAAMVVPVNTLLLRGEGARVAVVDEKGIVTLHKVELGKDFGQKIEVLSGVTVADRLVLNPPDSLSDGDQITIVEKKDKDKTDKSEKKS
ncbi:MAG: hypothetical protein RL618_920 [Pseudomonadota bacterium]|jgi:RND family efflux transporter MFP subunit